MCVCVCVCASTGVCLCVPTQVQNSQNTVQDDPVRIFCFKRPKAHDLFFVCVLYGHQFGLHELHIMFASVKTDQTRDFFCLYFFVLLFKGFCLYLDSDCEKREREMESGIGRWPGVRVELRPCGILDSCRVGIKPLAPKLPPRSGT